VRVRAKNEFGTSEISDTFQFHTHSAGTNIDTKTFFMKLTRGGAVFAVLLNLLQIY
jgi:hypothetical protein